MIWCTRRASVGTSWVHAVGCILAGGIVFGSTMVAASPERSDLRDLSVGMTVSDLPTDEYVDLACSVDPKVSLAKWVDFGTCQADSAGLHEVSFHYDDSRNPLAAVNDRYEGTKLGGHPVLLSLLIDKTGVVQRIRAVTDPGARPFMRKKAFLLAFQVKTHYGEEGWSCSDEQPSNDELSVGGIFIKEHCEKQAEHRKLLLDRLLYRKAGQSMKEFMNETRFEIEQAQ
jgi:hypothetical protein